MEQILSAIFAIIVGVGSMALYFYGTNYLLDMLLPDRAEANGTVLESREKQREAIRPWLFIGPAVLLLGLYLIYPAVQTLWLSFGNADGEVRLTRPVYPEIVDDLSGRFGAALSGAEAEQVETRLAAVQDVLGEEYPLAMEITAEQAADFDNVETLIQFILTESGEDIPQRFVLFRNYEWAFNSDEFWTSIRNNVLWLLVPFVSTALGLVIAVLADNVRWGAIAKSLIFMPMAISFVGASVIWKFVYDANPPNPGQPPPDQIGILNAMVVSLGGQVQDWIALPFWNNFFLMVILIWIQTGFAMVLMAAALRGVPEDTLEAARIDGANDIQIFFQIMIPQIMSTILVVLTTITIATLKIFDIVAAMTNGQFGTQVLANLMYNQAFRAFDDGRGSAVAIILMIAVTPILYWNIRQFQKEEQSR